MTGAGEREVECGSPDLKEEACPRGVDCLWSPGMGDDCAGSRQRYEGKSAKDQALGHIIIQGLNRGRRSERDRKRMAESRKNSRRFWWLEAQGKKCSKK